VHTTAAVGADEDGSGDDGPGQRVRTVETDARSEFRAAQPAGRPARAIKIFRYCVKVLFHSTPRPAPAPAGFVRRLTKRLKYTAAVTGTIALTALEYWSLKQLYGVRPLLAAAVSAAQCLPVLLAVRRPLPAWWLMMAAELAAAPVLLHQLPSHHTAGWPWPSGALVGQLLVLLALVRRERTATLAAVWVILIGFGYGLASSYPQYDDGANTLLAVVGTLILVVGWAVRERRRAERRLFQRQLAGEAERARIALLEERAQIARELHDVVAHHMSVITVQADSAPFRISDLPPEAGAEFGSIAAGARGALHEMRRLLGVLRSEQDPGGQLAPQPGLEQLPELVASAVRAGIPVELNTDARAMSPHKLLPDVELAVFRIVQESLANVVRHAPGARTRVDMWVSGLELCLEIANGAPTPADRTPGVDAAGSGIDTGGGTGHGLIGMRERVRLVGGTLDALPLRGGGFRVTARIPLTVGGEEADAP
jgi:signal transduction histidine kinase